MLSWMYWLSMGMPPVPVEWRQPRAAPGTAVGDLDLAVIRLVYEVVASESTCARCGAPLGRGLHVTPWAVDHPPWWTVEVATRCTGRRRHRNLATVDESGRNLVIGAFDAP